MPTTHPRITVQLTQGELRELDKMARALKRSRSKTAGMVLGGALPFMADITKAVRGKQGKEAVQAALLALMQDALADVNRQLDILQVSSAHAAGGGAGKRTRRGRTGTQPPSL